MRILRRVVVAAGVSASVAALAARVLAGPEAPQSDQTLPTFRGGAGLVLVDVYPQRDGRIVEGLTAADFDVFEDGKPQRIEQFEFVRVESGRFDGPRTDPQTIAESRTIAADPHTRVFVTFLDQAHTTLDGSSRIRQPLVDMLDRAMGRDDLFGVATPRMRPQDLTLGRRLESIDEQLEKYWAWGLRQRPYEAGHDEVEDMLSLCFHNRQTPPFDVWYVRDGGGTRPLDQILIDRRREDQTLQSLTDLVNYLGELREARSVLIVVSDGWVLYPRNRGLENEGMRNPGVQGGVMGSPPVGPGAGGGTAGRQPAINTANNLFASCTGELNRLAEYDGDEKFRALLTLAERYNVSVYPVASGGLAVFDSSLGDHVRAGMSSDLASGDAGRLTRRVEVLRTIAENTDGLAVVNSNDLGSGLRRIADDVSAYYLLGYAASKEAADGRFHRIEVKLKRPGLDVRARRGYIARRADSPAGRLASAGPVAAGAAPAVAAIEALGRFPAAADLFIRGRAAPGEVTIAVELGARPSEQPEWQNGGRVTVTLTAANGARVDPVTVELAPQSRAVLVHVPTAAAGPWQAAVRAETRGSALQESVRIAAGDGLAIAEPVAFRAQPSPRAPLRPTADIQFARSERLHLEFAVSGLIQSASVRLLDRRGQPLPVTLTPAQEDRAGQPTVIVDLPLAALAAGDYALEVAAATVAGTHQRLFAFRVSR